MRIIQAVPNFSEGRDAQVIDQILAEFDREGCQLLDHNADGDHNRLVVTAVGEPDGVVEACFSAAKKAAELIDMDEHSGSHPRIGAADVIPLIPIRDVTMTECVDLARALGRRLADELDIPVYLYEEAAERPERRNLANIRRGEYEGLKERISEAARRPDFGPARMPSAGATVVGARHPLIAYNVYLKTDDVEVANDIARVVRGSSGGFVNVKAIGLEVEGGTVQVSMNLTNFRRTALHRVFEFIKREAEHRGVTVDRSEVVGLIPQAALVAAARYYLRLTGFSPTAQILEYRLSEEE